MISEMMKQWKYLLVGAVIGLVFGFSISILFDRPDIPRSASKPISREATQKEYEICKVDSEKWLGELDGVYGGYSFKGADLPIAFHHQGAGFLRGKIVAVRGSLFLRPSNENYLKVPYLCFAFTSNNWDRGYVVRSSQESIELLDKIAMSDFAKKNIEDIKDWDALGLDPIDLK